MSLVNVSYVVITPVRDEGEHIVSTIESMVRQTLLPKEWVIVDDGSTDSTGSIIDDYANRYTWIRAVHRSDRGFRKPGGGVVDAFNEGYGSLVTDEWDYIVKFDGDLTFAPEYFEKSLDEFQKDQVLGIGGGVICYMTDGKKIFEEAPAFHVRGASKIYRKTCWNDIGGLFPAAGWDTIDEVKANSLGWSTRSFSHLHLLHQRDTGSADGLWPSLVKYGRANYICGYHPLFMMCKCILRLFRKPYLLGSIGLLYGFLSGYLKRVPRVNDQLAIRYLRRQQLRCLLGKSSIWG